MPGKLPISSSRLSFGSAGALSSRQLQLPQRPQLSSYLAPSSRNASSTASSPKSSNLLRNLGLFVSAVVLTTYYLDSRSAIHRYVIPPLLRAGLDAETAHRLAVNALASGLAPRDMLEDDEKLATELWGLKLSSPVSLAAGFDKNAEAIEGSPYELLLLGW